MSVTGWKNPAIGSLITRTSGVNWGDPTYIQAIDGNDMATVSLNKMAFSVYLRSQFSFTSSDVPAGATINGIEVQVVKLGGNGIVDDGVYLYTSAVVGSNLSSASNWPSSLGTVSYGGGTNLWGVSLSQSDVISTNFGFVLACVNNATDNTAAAVDGTKMRIYYTAGSANAELIKVGGVSKTVSSTKIKVGGVWKAVASTKIKVGGAWK